MLPLPLFSLTPTGPLATYALAYPLLLASARRPFAYHARRRVFCETECNTLKPNLSPPRQRRYQNTRHKHPPRTGERPRAPDGSTYPSAA